ncbi:MAG TPA: response regulator transcription factor [Planktothrix sp.]|jgi:DNA-binding response OmpR family regulator
MAKILLVEDDVELADQLRDWFSLENYIFETASNGEDAHQMLESFDYDVVVLDWSLPGASGLEICQRYRSRGGSAAVIFLTGRGDVPSKSVALDAGADDYMVKPFDVRELGARVRSLLRRPRTLMSQLKIGNVELKPETRTLIVGAQSLVLMPRQSALLEYLMRHPNRPYNSKALLDSVWPSDAEASEETVRTCMKTLRQQLGSLDKKDFIKTLYGSGYLIEDGSAAE